MLPHPLTASHRHGSVLIRLHELFAPGELPVRYHSRQEIVGRTAYLFPVPLEGQSVLRFLLCKKKGSATVARDEHGNAATHKLLCPPQTRIFRTAGRWVENKNGFALPAFSHSYRTKCTLAIIAITMRKCLRPLKQIIVRPRHSNYAQNGRFRTFCQGSVFCRAYSIENTRQMPKPVIFCPGNHPRKGGMELRTRVGRIVVLMALTSHPVALLAQSTTFPRIRSLRRRGSGSGREKPRC